MGNEEVFYTCKTDEEKERILDEKWNNIISGESKLLKIVNIFFKGEG